MWSRKTAILILIASLCLLIIFLIDLSEGPEPKDYIKGAISGGIFMIAFITLLKYNKNKIKE
jgi:hypothetical protein